VIIIKNPEELKKMRKACYIVATILEELKSYINRI